MRTIKFRGKNRDRKEWLYGDIIQYNHCSFGIDGEYVDPDSVGQFTGLLDKNGKEIYEGDIITIKGLYSRVVLWDKMMWALMPTEYYHDEYFWVMNLQHPGLDWWEEHADEFEIIGNIYENPDMLKGGNHE